MLLDLNNIFAIVSAHKEYKTKDALTHDHEQLGFFMRANGFKTTEVFGSYNDIKEKSWLVTGSPNSIGWPLYELIKSMAQSYNQDSFILCDGTGSALEIDACGNRLKIFTSVTPSLPSDPCYTIMPDGTRLTLR